MGLFESILCKLIGHDWFRISDTHSEYDVCGLTAVTSSITRGAK